MSHQPAGRPVIAYGHGGALDTVVEGETGVFFHEPTPEALAAAARAFDPGEIDPRACRANAERFAAGVFRDKLSRFTESALNQRKGETDRRTGDSRVTRHLTSGSQVYGDH